jgi:hypothetical protein
MNWKTTAEAEVSFRPIERMLDESRSNLVNEGILMREESNRTGFGGHSYPAFIWGFHFENRQPFVSDIKRAKVQLTYRETLLEGESQRMEVTTVAEIFQIGKQSRFSEGRKMIYPIDQFLNMRMDSIIIDCIATAKQVLSKY